MLGKETLSKISDIKNLKVSELKNLSQELREEILLTAQKNGGHLASNLGIIETTVALYHVFNFPTDKLIFDVGHQCYAHKILSGRAENFCSLRERGGISGFPNADESEYDLFTTGHAGTSISSGIGLCIARDKQKEDFTVVSVVGDGSLVNGLNMEALSFSSGKPKKFIVVLNDNGMSISKNLNGFYQFLSKSTTRKNYIKGKTLILRVFGNSFVTRGLSCIKNFFKRLIGKYDRFEEFGFKYVGIVDGNDMGGLVKIMERVKQASKREAILLHVRTKKGKGYKDAEENADVYHGVGKNLASESGDFSIALGQKINELIEKDDRIIAITAGMKDGTGLSIVEKEHPEHFIDVGIAEEFAITVAGAIAKGGRKPVVCIYSTFMQRAYDQIVHDVCLQNQSVVMCLDRAGLVGKDGKTHQGVFDLSYLLHLPNLSILAPTTAEELKDALEYAIKQEKPVAIRYPKNQVTSRKSSSFFDGLWVRIKDGDKVTLLAVGPKMLSLAEEFSLGKEGVGVISARTIKPLCEKTLDEIKNTVIVTLEENSAIGGFGAFVAKYYHDKKIAVNLIIKGVPDEFIGHATDEEQLQQCLLTKEDLELELGQYL